MNEKTIFHIDIDSFFASAEISIRPELRNKEVAIARNARSNSIVSALSYEAKAKGAKVPMKIYEVKKFCPNIIILEPNFDLYTTISNDIYQYLYKNYCKEIEIGSIDEWYLDVSDIVKKYKDPYLLAQEIQINIFKKFNLNVSIGISYNKFLAKISTDLNKPQGITVTNKNNFESNISVLDIEKYTGIGFKNQELLRNIGINKIGDLAMANPYDYRIKKIFKNKTKDYIDKAKGITIDDKINILNNNLTTIGNMTTFENGPTNNIVEIFNEIKCISKTIESRLSQRLKIANSIYINIKYSKNKSLSSSIRLIKPINNYLEIYNEAINLFNKNWDENKIICIGVTVGDLSSIYEEQFTKNLFDNKENNENKNQVRTIINEINEKFKDKVCYSLNEYEQDKTIKNYQSKYLKK